MNDEMSAKAAATVRFQTWGGHEQPHADQNVKNSCCYKFR